MKVNNIDTDELYPSNGLIARWSGDKGIVKVTDNAECGNVHDAVDYRSEPRFWSLDESLCFDYRIGPASYAIESDTLESWVRGLSDGRKRWVELD